MNEHQIDVASRIIRNNGLDLNMWGFSFVNAKGLFEIACFTWARVSL
jgi:hypothetical protein